MVAYADPSENKWNHDSEDHEQVIRIGFEETPGLLQQDGKGIINLALKSIKKKTHLKFKTTYMAYSRAKLELKKKNLDLIGLIPQGEETKHFYEYADELNWSFDTSLVLFCNQKEDLKIKKDLLLGTPTGNEEFIAEILKIPMEQFIIGSFDSVVLRTKKKRTSCFVFEEISSLILAKELGIKKLHYKVLKKTRGSFGIHKSALSKRQKMTLENALNSIKWDELMKDIKRLPKGELSGVVNL